jgi:hypothetical protein
MTVKSLPSTAHTSGPLTSSSIHCYVGTEHERESHLVLPHKESIVYWGLQAHKQSLLTTLGASNDKKHPLW